MLQRVVSSSHILRNSTLITLELNRVLSPSINLSPNFHPQYFPLPSGPLTCLDNSKSTTLRQLVDCLDSYTVSHNYYSPTTYNAAQPNAEERAAWKAVTSSIMEVDGHCCSVVVPAPLAGIYTVSQFTGGSGTSYCVLSESQEEDGSFAKGWGYMIVPTSARDVSRHIHISAPHPAYDLNTPQQAAALFELTGAKSLFISGRIRTAFLDPTDCIPSTTRGRYYRTDPAHDKLEPFYDATKSIQAWQAANGGCPTSSCAFIQFHGKGPYTCRFDQIFLSTGLGSSASSKSWYTNNTPRAIKTLKRQLKLVFPTWNVSLPSDSSCILTATKNVVGRFLNGIDDSMVCHSGSNAKLATGVFIHIEQAAGSRAEFAYDGWKRALTETFKTVS